jgi:archaeosine synthase beta-subunit
VAAAEPAVPAQRRRGRARAAPDPWLPVAVLEEDERGADGRLHRWLTVFLAGAECPFGCVFCDLWRHTLNGPTPPGALPAQVRAARERHPGPFHGLKLYNASNLFEPRAAPPGDDPALAAAAAGVHTVVAECHPGLVGGRCLAFAGLLAEHGVRLEVAMGLETVHPEALPRLGKSMHLSLFDRACDTLLAAGCGVRAFVLVGAPFVPPDESVDWAVRSAAHALARGATHVALIPVRGGTPEMAALAAAGHWTPPRLADLESALGRALAAAPPATVVTADLWDLDRWSDCPGCFAERRERLKRLNRTGRAEPAIACRLCATAQHH